MRSFHTVGNPLTGGSVGEGGGVGVSEGNLTGRTTTKSQNTDLTATVEKRTFP